MGEWVRRMRTPLPPRLVRDRPDDPVEAVQVLNLAAFAAHRAVPRPHAHVDVRTQLAVLHVGARGAGGAEELLHAADVPGGLLTAAHVRLAHNLEQTEKEVASSSKCLL